MGGGVLLNDKDEPYIEVLISLSNVDGCTRKPDVVVNCRKKNLLEGPWSAMEGCLLSRNQKLLEGPRSEMKGCLLSWNFLKLNHDYLQHLRRSHGNLYVVIIWFSDVKDANRSGAFHFATGGGQTFEFIRWVDSALKDDCEESMSYISMRVSAMLQVELLCFCNNNNAETRSPSRCTSCRGHTATVDTLLKVHPPSWCSSDLPSSIRI